MENAVGLLKEEMRRCNSLILSMADAHAVPAGGALAVDRYAFSDAVTEQIRSHPNITVIEEEVTEIPAQGIPVLICLRPPDFGRPGGSHPVPVPGPGLSPLL